MNEMKYLRPRLPEKEIELCLDLFDKQEAKKRILDYIKGIFDDAESQIKNCFIHDVLWRSEQFSCKHPEDKIWYNYKSQMQCNECGEEL